MHAKDVYAGRKTSIHKDITVTASDKLNDITVTTSDKLNDKISNLICKKHFGVVIGEKQIQNISNSINS